MQLNPNKSKELKDERENSLLKVLKFFVIKENTNTKNEQSVDEKRELIESIKNARKEWENANLNFEFAAEAGIIDYYTYKIKACEVRYDYLVRKAKEKGIRAEFNDTSTFIFEGTI
jgi:hypothetical protein